MKLGDLMNYFECGQDGFFTSTYMYVDSRKHLADDFFVSNKLNVEFLDEIEYLNSKYIIVFVNIFDKKSYLFVKSMIELSELMEERGYDDYEDVCNKIFDNEMKVRAKRCINL